MHDLLKELAKISESQELLTKFIEKKELFKEFVLEILRYAYENLMNIELDEELGYEKWDRTKEKTNYRNGIRTRDLLTEYGKIKDLRVPRARKGFYPAILDKYKRSILDIDDIVINMYSTGSSTESISKHIENIYGEKFSKTSISNIIKKVDEDVKAFKNREIESNYYVIFMDGIKINIRRGNSVTKETFHILLGVNEEGKREVLGFYLNPEESSSFYNEVFEDLKQRGLNKVLLFVTDGLKGIEEVISDHFPKAKIQRCIVHVNKNLLQKTRRRDRASLIEDFKRVYKSSNKEEALKNYELFKLKWGKMYPSIVKNLNNILEYLLTFYEFPESIRGQIYTTNWIERLNREIRKVIHSKSSFPTVDSSERMMYLILKDYMNKWENRTLRGFKQAKYELDSMMKEIYG